jgi:pyruvyl transferase EpsO
VADRTPDSAVRQRRDLIDSLQATYRSVAGAAIPPGEVSLLDYPAHDNVGDTAIWLGERAYLRQDGRRVAHASDAWTGEAGLSALPGTVLLHGGGNFGDLWTAHQDFRERVLATATAARVVQLPQTLHFRDPARLEQARRVIDGHPDFVLLVRDQPSHDLAATTFDCAVELCPDAAFMLGDLSRRRKAPETDVLVLGRTDAEATATGGWPAGATTVDWVGGSQRPAMTASLRAHQVVRHHLRPLEPRLRVRFYDYWAGHHVRRGTAILSRGRVVVTDRLHAHILCLLLGIPHVLLDNSYGKLRAFHETWTFTSPITHWAQTRPEAVELAHALAGGQP